MGLGRLSYGDFAFGTLLVRHPIIFLLVSVYLLGAFPQPHWVGELHFGAPSLHTHRTWGLGSLRSLDGAWSRAVDVRGRRVRVSDAGVLGTRRRGAQHWVGE
jgi:hypothetical protein